MFNDERINKELSNLKKYIIILSLIISSIFLGIKLFYLSKYDLSIIYYFTEIMIILMSFIILIGRLFIKSDIKDEAFYEKVNKYYNKSFKIFVFLSFLSFSFVMGGTVLFNNPVFSSSQVINLLLPLSLFIGYAYIRYKNIYFNYNIIEEDNKTYYKGVFKNILKIILFFLIIYSVGILSTLFYTSNKNLEFNRNDFIGAILSIIIAFFISSIGVSLYYFIISLSERAFVKEEEDKKITIPTIILCVLGILFNIVYLIVCIREKILINQQALDPSSIPNFAAIISKLSNTENFFKEWTIHLQSLGLVFLIYDISKNNKILKNKFNIPLLIFILYNCFLLIIIKLDPIILECIKDLPQNDISHFVNIKYLVLNVISIIVIMTLLIIILIKLKDQLIKYKGLFLLLIVKFIITIVDFSLSFKDNIIIRNYLQITWLIVLLIAFIIYIFNKNRIEKIIANDD